MLAMRQKREIFSRMVGVAAGSRLDVIPVVVDRHNSGQQRSRRRPLAVGWSAMFRRFERLLDVPRGESGLILADAGRRGDENAARAIVEKMGRARMERAPDCAGVLNGVIYRDSRLDVMVQLADTVAYVVHKHHRGNPHFRGGSSPSGPGSTRISPRRPSCRPWRVRRRSCATLAGGGGAGAATPALYAGDGYA